MVARPLGRNSTVRSSLSTHLSIRISGEQEQEQSGGSQASREEQYGTAGSSLSTHLSFCSSGEQEQEQSRGSQALGRNSTVGSSLSTHLSFCSSGEQEQEQSGGSQASGEEQYSGKLLIHTFIYLFLRRARAGEEWW